MSVSPEQIEKLNARVDRRESVTSGITTRQVVWLVSIAALTAFVLWRYGAAMDIYEVSITAGTGISLAWLGWRWAALQPFTLCVALLSIFAIWLYGDDITRGEQSFFLKYAFASQTAIMWMSALLVGSTVSYSLGLFARSDFALSTGTGLAWCGVTMSFVGMLVRWRESYLINVEYGHIPVSNLYEVFILFCAIAGLTYLYYESRVRTRTLGAFAMLVISAAVAFLLWYAFEREADVIQPLVPALNSYWMKIHVPANFIGYGAFAIAAMLGCAQLIAARGGAMATRLPAIALIEDLIYRLIALGFAFFTIATVLGALWAAEAWGSYWSWDPKETWALIVWLNYAAWLHLRLTHGWRGGVMAWWAIIGLFVTLFAFLGVNMFLSGLHSYGEL